MGSIPGVSRGIQVHKSIGDSLELDRLAEDYNLEMMYRKPFAEVWKEEQEHSFFGPLSERMGVRERNGGPLMVSEEEMDAASTIVDHPCF